jgi:hypothetical protein
LFAATGGRLGGQPTKPAGPDPGDGSCHGNRRGRAHHGSAAIDRLSGIP